MYELKDYVIKSDDSNILNCNNSIFNLTEVMMCIDYHNDYEIHLYSVGELEYINIESENLLKSIKSSVTENLNHILLHEILHDDKVINIFVTPIVKSA
jgi:hypothetical protein